MSNAVMGMVGYAELIALSAATPDDVRARAKAILDQGQRVMALLEQLSELTRAAPDGDAHGDEPMPPPINGPA
jgi:hypothetical protein